MPRLHEAALWFSRARKSWLALVTAAALAGVGAVLPVFDLWDHVEVAAGWKPDALQLARNTEKGTFSRNLVQVAWRRMFWMRRYASAVGDELPASDQAEIWNGYVKVLETWNTELMTNIIQLNEYYDASRTHDFQYRIQPKFGELHACMVRLHYRAIYEAKGQAGCSIGDQHGETDVENAKLLEHGIDDLNVMLFCFASGLTPKGTWCSAR